MDELEFFAVAAPGLESPVARELAALGLGGVQRLAGGVAFRGPLRAAYVANLWLRGATRVLLRVGSFEAPSFAALGEGLRNLPWGRWLPAGAPIAATAVCHGSRLARADLVARRAGAAIGACRAGGPAHRAGPAGAAGSAHRVLLRFEADRCTVSLDTSGDLLHRRGYRPELVRAPLRETAAAAVLQLCGWAPTSALVDPLCGSGTFVIEAALMALGRAPGLGRHFAFETFPEFEPDVFAALRAAAGGARPGGAALAPLCGSDRNPAAVAMAGRNAARAGVAEHVSFAVADVAALHPPSAVGHVVANPPFGVRLGNPRALRALYAGLAATLRARFRGWQATLVVGGRADPAWFGPGFTAVHEFAAGGLRLTLVRATL